MFSMVRFLLQHGKQWKFITLILIVFVIGSSLVFLQHTAFASGGSYYVDCSAGSDGNGTQSSPWNALNDVNSFNAPTGFSAGEQILFNARTTCKGANRLMTL